MPPPPRLGDPRGEPLEWVVKVAPAVIKKIEQKNFFCETTICSFFFKIGGNYESIGGACIRRIKREGGGRL